MSIATRFADDLYTTDFYAWSQAQAKIIRSLEHLEGMLPEGLDLDNIAEEISSLGTSQLHAVESQLQNILVHLLKAVSDPDSEALAHWRAETVTFHIELNRKYTPSMRQLIRVEKTWHLAKRIAEAQLSTYGRPLVAPIYCPFTIADFTATTFDWNRAVEKMLARLQAKA